MSCPSCKENVDLMIQNEGSIFLLRAVSDDGKAWVAEHLPNDAQTFGNAIVVEHRYIGDIAAGAMADGLNVR